MKLINCICGSDSCVWSLWNKIVPRQIGRTMSEEDILYLEDIFLTNGLHAISVADVQAGRSIIHSMLQSLNFYQTVSCLTSTQMPPLEESIVDLYSRLSTTDHDLQYEDVEHFFIEEFFSDFLWIELSQRLMNTTLLAHTFHALNALDMIGRMPIVTLSFAE